MEEYIFYVILIFVPIGGAMAYLLHKDGLQGKYINIILILSLLIILSFPISMERMGGLASLMIYVLLIAVVSWYILKCRVGDLALFTSRTSTGEQYVNNLINDEMSAIPVTSETPENDESGIIETSEEISETEEISEEKVSLRTTPEGNKAEELIPEADIVTDEGFESDSNLVDLLESEGEGNELEPEQEADVTPEAIEVEEQMEEVQITTTVEPAPGMELTPEAILEEKREEEYLPEAAASSKDTELPTDINKQVEPLITETFEPVLIDAGTDEEDEIDEIDKVDEIPESPMEIQDSVTILIPDSEEPQMASSSTILELIDNGFACRDVNKEEAAGYFEEAWHNTSEYELRYMLTMELLQIYKECGCYSRAESILNSFIALPGHKSDIINEINRQIDYISLLTAELERLGISDLPISRVPRWVRLKVDGEMNPPGV
jgi:hypothetical protein